MGAERAKRAGDGGRVAVGSSVGGKGTLAAGTVGAAGAVTTGGVGGDGALATGTVGGALSTDGPVFVVALQNGHAGARSEIRLPQEGHETSISRSRGETPRRAPPSPCAGRPGCVEPGRHPGDRRIQSHPHSISLLRHPCSRSRSDAASPLPARRRVRPRRTSPLFGAWRESSGRFAAENRFAELDSDGLT